MDLAAIRERQMRRLRATGPGIERCGGSQPRAWVMAGGRTFQLKLAEDERHRWVFFNELLGVVLGSAAGLCVAPSALIEISDDITLIDNLGRRLPGGVYFGSCWLDDYAELGESDLTKDAPATLQAALLRPFAFDLILMNGDRKHRDLLRLRGAASATGDLMLVDHGNALFGADWTAPELEKKKLEIFAPGLGSWAYRYVTDSEAALDAMHHVADAVRPRLSALLDAVFATRNDAERRVKMTDAERTVVNSALTTRLEQGQGLIERQIAASAEYGSQASRT